METNDAPCFCRYEALEYRRNQKQLTAAVNSRMRDTFVSPASRVSTPFQRAPLWLL